MVQLSGTYNNGSITLDKKISINKPVKVLVTFLDEDVTDAKNNLPHNRFSFSEGREILKNLQSSLSDAVIEERKERL
jgi:hypothetical protein